LDRGSAHLKAFNYTGCNTERRERIVMPLEGFEPEIAALDLSGAIFALVHYPLHSLRTYSPETHFNTTIPSKRVFQVTSFRDVLR
jgi:hypothetical protein